MNISQRGSEVVALAPDLALSVPHSLHSRIVEILRTEVLSGIEGHPVGLDLARLRPCLQVYVHSTRLWHIGKHAQRLAEVRLHHVRLCNVLLHDRMMMLLHAAGRCLFSYPDEGLGVFFHEA